jgi:hypothetical protein
MDTLDIVGDILAHELANPSGAPHRYIRTPYGVAAVTGRYVADHDAGDEDPSEVRGWTVVAKLLRPITVPGAIHRVAIRGEVSV